MISRGYETIGQEYAKVTHVTYRLFCLYLVRKSRTDLCR